MKLNPKYMSRRDLARHLTQASRDLKIAGLTWSSLLMRIAAKRLISDAMGAKEPG